MKNAVYMLTRNFYEKALPSINSMLLNTSVDRIYILAEDDSFPYDLPKIEAINISRQKYIRHISPNWEGHRFSYMVLMRCALHRILDIDKVLSVDADTIFLEDVSELYEMDMTDY